MFRSKPTAGKRAFQKFLIFTEAYKEFFIPRIDELILKASEETDESFAGKNKKELEMISQQKLIL